MKTIFEGEHFLAVERTASLPLRSPYEGLPGGVVEALTHTREEEVFEGPRFGDAFSGAVVLARSPAAAKALRRATSKGQLRWTFLAVARGRLQANDEVTVVSSRGAQVLVEVSTAEPSIKALRRRLEAHGLKVAHGARAVRLMSVRGPHPCNEGARLELDCRGDGGMRAALEEGEPTPEDLVLAALEARTACLLDAETDAWRMLCGEGDAEPGLTVDLFGGVALMSAREGAFRASPQRAEAIGRALVASVPRLESLYLRKVSARGKLLEPVGDPLVGPPCEEVVLCRERGLTYVIRPLHGLSPGLFLDQRHNRARVLERSAGARVLNTFAHTCGFSVAAAAGGAAEVVSVDASRRYLDWGRENLAANGFAADAQTFVAGDVLQYMSRAQRQGRLFDLIVLDPPTFGRDKKSGKTFSITKDLRALLEHTAKVAAPGADVLLCTNHRATSGRDLRSALDLAVGRKGWSFVDEPRLPPDFAMDPQFAKTLWVRFE